MNLELVNVRKLLLYEKYKNNKKIADLVLNADILYKLLETNEHERDN